MRGSSLAAIVALGLSGCSLAYCDDRAVDGASATAATSSGGDTSAGDPSTGAGGSGNGGAGDGGSGAGGPSQTVTGSTTTTTGGGGEPASTGTGGSGGAGTASTGAGAGGAGPLPCGGTTLLADPFGAGAQAVKYTSRLWGINEAGGDVSFGDDEARFIPSDPSVASRLSLDSNHVFSIVDEAVAAHVVAVLQGSGSVSSLQLTSGQQVVAIQVAGGQIQAFHGLVDDPLTFIAGQPYDAGAHAFWRMRHESDREGGGYVLFEAGPDGTSYAAFASIPASVLGDLSLVRASLIASTTANGEAPGQMRVAEVRGLYATPDACPMSSFDDAFSSSQVSLEWLVYEDRCTMDESSGDLHVSFPPASCDGGCPYCVYGTTRLYDMREDDVSVEIVAAPPTDLSLAMGLDFIDLYWNFASIGVVAGEVHMTSIVDGQRPAAQTETITLPEADRRWLRIRVVGGDTLFETSSDGVGWITRRSTPTWFDASAVQVRLFAAPNVPIESQVDLRFDDFNAP